jgi:murein DD-endopeptidase MepM/ murein hydrolase activator NlpD
MHRSAALLAVVGTVALAAPAMAQEGEPPTTTVPSTTTTGAPTTVGTTTTTIGNPDDPVGGEDAPQEEVPLVDVTVPPRPGASVTGSEAAQVVRRELHVAEADVVTADAGFELALGHVRELEAELLRLHASIDRLSVEKRRAIYRHEQARTRFEERAADALIRGDISELSAVLGAGSPEEAGRRTALLSSVLDADDRAVRDYIQLKGRLARQQRETAEKLATTTRDLGLARFALADAQRERDNAHVNLAVFAAGSEIVIHGFVFPVADPHNFGDSFGAPRMPGTQYAHAHQGTDILAPAGTELLACERGIVTQMGTDVLGGTKLWLKGESGTYYYYAHLSAFAPGLVDGTIVEAGTVVGYVGDTGNARGGPAHLHFEIHPDGGPAVNPYPLLKVVDALRKRG